jgi:hypothetical protein
MRTTLVLAAVGALAVSATAYAQAWKEYSYNDQGFAAQFPADPKHEQRSYATAHGTGVIEHVYSANVGGVIYAVQIADFSRSRPDERTVIDEAANALIGMGRMTDDVSARLNWNYGREIRVVDSQGTSYTDAIFLINNKLFQLKVTYPAVNTDPNGSSGIHFFQQAVRLLY